MQTFSRNGDILYLCPAEGNDIYQLENGKIQTKYSFDFGEYNLPKEYYECANLGAIGELIKDKTIASKLDFWGNDNCAILEGMRQTGFTAFNPFCGIKDRKKDTWKWFNFKVDSFIFFRYMDNGYAYFIADPEMVKQLPGLAERFPRLNTLSMNDGMVLFKASTKNIIY